MSGHDPEWVRIATRELGVRERPGGLNHPRILEYHRTTKLGATSDEVSWCAAFVSWCLEQAGVTSTRSAAARSYLTWGRELKTPQTGCVAVFSRGDNLSQGHVGFVLGSEGDELLILGGNQGNAVSIKRYPKSRLLSLRMPVAK